MKVRATLSYALLVAPEEPEGSLLLETMRVWREAVRHVVDYVIRTRQTGLTKVHRALYRLLRERYGLPARLAIDALRQGLWIAKAWLKNPNRGRRPMIKRLWMVLTPKLSYTFKAQDTVSILTLRGRKFYGLRYVPKWHGQYESWVPKEARLVFKDGRFWFKVVVEREIALMEPRGVLGVDINWENVTLSDGTCIEIRAFRRAYELKIHAERIQKRHRKSWRYVRAIRHRIKALGARARHVIEDACRKTALQVACIALEQRKAVILEDLSGLLNAKNRLGRDWRTRLALWAYRKLQAWIGWKCLQLGVPVFKVSPRGTSSTCPKCG